MSEQRPGEEEQLTHHQCCWQTAEPMSAHIQSASASVSVSLSQLHCAN